MFGFHGAMEGMGGYTKFRWIRAFLLFLSSFTKRYLGNLVHTTNQMRMTKEEDVDDLLFIFFLPDSIVDTKDYDLNLTLTLTRC